MSCDYHVTIAALLYLMLIIGGGRKFCLGGKVLFAHENFGLHPLFEVQRSVVPIEGTTAVSSKEMVENVDNYQFSRLF